MPEPASAIAGYRLSEQARLGLGRAFAGASAVLVIVLIDRWLAAAERTLLQTGLVDECAHLLTAALLASAIPARLPVGFIAGMIAGTVVIDVDHLPLILGSDLLTRETNRPLTHCLLSIVIALAFAGIGPTRWRWLGAGVAAGFAAHFWRDLATSTAGVPLLWPWLTTGFLTPYPVYLGSLIICVVMVTVRQPRCNASLIV